MTWLVHLTSRFIGRYAKCQSEMYFVKAKELKEIIKVVDNGISRFQEFIDSEQIINPRIRNNLAKSKMYFERAVEETRRY